MAKQAAVGLKAPKQLSSALQAVVGKKVASRMECVKALWDYIKKHDLQDSKDKRTINPDKTLGAVLGSKPIHMMKMAGKLSEHLS